MTLRFNSNNLIHKIYKKKNRKEEKSKTERWLLSIQMTLLSNILKSIMAYNIMDQKNRVNLNSRK